MSRPSRVRQTVDAGSIPSTFSFPLMPGRRSGGRRAMALAAVLLPAWFWSGCGAQGPPQPPRLERPQAIKDLAVEQEGRTLEVRFTLPQLATDGERLTKPLEIEILRGTTQPGAPPPAALALAPWLTLNARQWQPHLRGNRIVYAAPLSEQDFTREQGSLLTLGVRTLTRGFRHRALESRISNLVSLPLLDVPRPVTDLVAVTTEKAIRLSWTPPTETLRGKPLRDLTGYRVYRSTTGKPDSYAFLSEVSSPSFLDFNFEFGRTYFYRVRAVMRVQAVSGQSENSPVAEVTARDIFPPAAPTGLTAVYSPGAVELVWTANTERDLAGYNVYRREGQGEMVRITKDLLRTPLLRDGTVQPNRTYFYQVTAVDLSGNESLPSQEVQVETQ